MIDITVDGICREIRVEHQNFSFNQTDEIVAAIKLIINKCMYSSESITLWDVVSEKDKKLVQEW